MGRLEGRTALVTGGGSGIGRAVCRAFAHEGADLAIVDFNHVKGAETVAEEARSLGRRSFALCADVTDEQQVRASVAEAISSLGHLDVCVANAGIGGQAVPLEALTLEQWSQLINGNLTSVYLTLHAVLPHMIERRAGRIITTSSQLAHKPAQELAAYSASKAGVVALTVAVAQEVARYGIRVNTVAPGPTRTAMTDVSGRPEYAEWLDRKLAGLPLGRLSEPEEIAPAFVFLASDDAEVMIGQTVSPNGGDVFW